MLLRNLCVSLKFLLVIFTMNLPVYGAEEYSADRLEKEGIKVAGSLSQYQVNEFLRDGVLILPKFLGPSQIEMALGCVDKLNTAVEELAQGAPVGVETKCMHEGTQFVFTRKEEEGTPIVHRYVWAQGSVPELSEITRSLKILGIVQQLFGGVKTADHLISQVHTKGDPKVVFVAHQDIENRKSFDRNWKNVNGELSYLVFIMALDPADENNGGLWGVLGSHKWGELNLKQSKVPLDNPLALKEELSSRGIENSQIDYLRVGAGDMIIMHPYFIHGSSATNREALDNNNTRRTLLTGYAYPGANSELYPGEGSSKRINLENGSLE